MSARRRRIDPDVVDALTDLLVAGGHSARGALRIVEADRQYRGRTPSLRTVASMAAELRPPCTSVAWTLATSDDPGEAALVLPVLATVVENSDGRIRGMTRDTARWVARIARAAPGLEPPRIYQYAVRYQVRPDPTLDLELAREIAKTPRRG